jgi:TetR/AcrR family transcriptional regulator, transcriptional repressor for nem operon
MGIGKSSFYLAFKRGKKELFERALEQRSAQAMKRVEKGLQESEDKLEFLKSLFYSILDVNSPRYLNGCMLGNAVAELANVESELKEKAASLLLRLENVFLKVLKDGIANGSLQTKEQPEVLAKYLLTVWNGLNISVRLYSDKETLKPLIEKHLEIVK